MDLSPDQKQCFDIMMEWVLRPKKPILTFGGYAGTGKTTIIGLLRGSLPASTRIAFCAYTGKAASVLRSKLSNHAIRIYGDDYCGTIHGLIYEPVVDEASGEIVGWSLLPQLDYDLIIIDEASMVGGDLYDDLSSFGLPILAVGDHGQLPPIEGSLNLMENPEIRLEKIHRFAEQDALIKVSIQAREDGEIPYGFFSDLVCKVRPKHLMVTKFINDAGSFNDSAILCGFNRTRVDLNKKIREWNSKKGKFPSYGERVICLRNNKDAQHCPIYNGVLGTVKSCIDKYDHLKLRVSIDGESDMYEGCVSSLAFNNEKPTMDEFIFVDQCKSNEISERFFQRNSSTRRKKFLDYFDFGYVLTVHKSQGSEWDNVMVVEQPCSYWSGNNWNRWLYTAVTRSRKRLLIVS
jgi:exodeoxyribonuclease V